MPRAINSSQITEKAVVAPSLHTRIMYEGYRRRIKKNLIVLRKQLKSLESGRIGLGKHKVEAASWPDASPREITRLKAVIADYEAILARYEKPVV